MGVIKLVASYQYLYCSCSDSLTKVTLRSLYRQVGIIYDLWCKFWQVIPGTSIYKCISSCPSGLFEAGVFSGDELCGCWFVRVKPQIEWLILSSSERLRTNIFCRADCSPKEAASENNHWKGLGLWNVSTFTGWTCGLMNLCGAMQQVGAQTLPRICQKHSLYILWNHSNQVQTSGLCLWMHHALGAGAQ